MQVAFENRVSVFLVLLPHHIHRHTHSFKTAAFPAVGFAHARALDCGSLAGWLASSLDGRTDLRVARVDVFLLHAQVHEQDRDAPQLARLRAYACMRDAFVCGLEKKKKNIKENG